MSAQDKPACSTYRQRDILVVGDPPVTHIAVPFMIASIKKAGTWGVNPRGDNTPLADLGILQKCAGVG